jgi:hypothetical protein
MKNTKKQTGTPSSGNYTGKKAKKATKTKNPWGGPNIPLKFKSNGGVSGSSRRLAKPAPELSGMNYPANSPVDWPVEPDFVGHTVPPSTPAAVITANNTAVERAYTRAKYQ